LAEPATQLPPEHASPFVHALPSLHASVLLALTQPVLPLQESFVHALPSSHVNVEAGTHAPPVQLSGPVHGLLSVQGSVLLVNLQPLAGSQVSVVHALLSLHAFITPARQLPPEHASPTVQLLLSLQLTVLLVYLQPVTGSHVSFVHALPSSQPMTVPGTHTPPAQASFAVHTLLSLQGAVLSACLHPAETSQLSAVHGLPSSQPSAAPALQVPLAHTSPAVHALLSLHAWVLFALTQPVAVEHESVVQLLASSQPSAVPPHKPFVQTSLPVQALPSSHAAVLFACLQPLPTLQESTVHALLSSQFVMAPPVQVPVAQVSPVVHALPSSQAALLAACAQPVLLSQESVVHALLSSQLVALLPAQPPPPQTSPLEQALPSSHAAVLFTCLQASELSHVSVVQGLPSSQLLKDKPLHSPPWQASPVVHALPSSQLKLLSLCVQPLSAAQASVVHTLLSSQASAPVGAQMPAPQTSPVVQALPSLHAAVLLLWAQPLLGLQVSLVHGLLSSHWIAVPGTHEPAAHASPSVQALPSEQPTVVLACTQPEPDAHESSVHRLSSLQSTGWPLHTPAAHTSPVVQALPSLQLTVVFTCKQPLAGLQVSMVHGLLSSQPRPAPDTQLPAAHASPTVHALPSEQGAVRLLCAQPLAAEQVSPVHGLLSSHATAWPAQIPPKHASFCVQAEPSSQPGVPSAALA